MFLDHMDIQNNHKPELFSDEYFMNLALKEARKAVLSGEVPIGAVIVEDNIVIGSGYNQTISFHDPTAHAEVLAIRNACLVNQNYRLTGCDLYVTLEPCIMCLAAAVHARIKSLIFGALDPKSGAAVSIMTFPFDNMNHRVKIKGGILETECGNILKEFFRTKRKL